MVQKYRQYAHQDPDFRAPPKAGPSVHPIFAAHKSIGLISAEDPYTNPIVPGGHDALKQHLTNSGLSFHETHGKYNKPERSFIVHNPTREHMIDLGRKFGQESVIHSEGGQHKLIYTAGPKYGHYHAGSPGMEVFEHPPEDFHTAVPGGGHFRMRFDWDNLHKLPASHAEEHKINRVPSPVEAPAATLKSESQSSTYPQGRTLVSDKFVSIPELRKALAESIKGKIDSYTKELVALRQKELKKNLDPQALGAAADPAAMAPAQGIQVNPLDMCPTCGKDDKPGSCLCLGQPAAQPAAPALAPVMKDEMGGPDETSNMKSEDMIDLSHEGDPEKRIKEVKGPHQGVVPGDKKSRVIDTSEGSGGTVTKKGELSSDSDKYSHYLVHKETGAVVGGNEYKEDAHDAAKDHHEPVKVVHHTRVPHAAKVAFHTQNKIMGKMHKAEVPMAKPPSGKNMATATPVASNTSKPGLAKGDFGMAPTGKPATTPAAAGVGAVKPAVKPAFGMNDLAAGKAKLQAAGVKPISPLGAPKLPGMGAPKPAAPAAPAFTAPPKAAAPAGAKPALPKPMAAPAPKMAAPKPAAPAMGKNEDFGNCAMCSKKEHNGACK